MCLYVDDFNSMGRLEGMLPAGTKRDAACWNKNDHACDADIICITCMVIFVLN